MHFQIWKSAVIGLRCFFSDQPDNLNDEEADIKEQLFNNDVLELIIKLLLNTFPFPRSLQALNKFLKYTVDKVPWKNTASDLTQNCIEVLLSVNTGCPKSSFLYFISLYFSTIGLGKQIISTKVVSFNIIHYFHTCCAVF